MEKGPSGPTAIETRVGWVLSGPIESDSTDQITVGFVDIHILRVDMRSDQLETDEGLRQFWELKSMGINPIEESVHSRFTREIKFRDGRYEVSLPWRKSHPKLPENYELCVNRLHSLYRRLQ